MVVTLLVIIIAILLLGRERFLGITGGIIKTALLLLLGIVILGALLQAEDPSAVALFLGVLAITVVFVKRIL